MLDLDAHKIKMARFEMDMTDAIPSLILCSHSLSRRLARVSSANLKLDEEHTILLSTKHSALLKYEYVCGNHIVN